MSTNQALSEEQILEFKDAFSIFDKGKTYNV
jgi:Ca2+-binding EF-hand superfamily protein